MAYVDGFVMPIPKTKIASYRRMAAKAGKIWRKYGALDYKECVGDDLETKMGKSFKSIARTKRGETVVFSYIVYRSKAHRNSVNKKVMKDPFMTNFDPKDMPVDMRRMAYGGFKVVVDA
ncbi:MAG TPA: DUF1428 domain-containing protein [Gemmatimonadaceae bacterium]|nr:DUF1428 domain-containing protein [Gemmatimonadaceae bacterium]